MRLSALVLTLTLMGCTAELETELAQSRTEIESLQRAVDKAQAEKAVLEARVERLQGELAQMERADVLRRLGLETGQKLQAVLTTSGGTLTCELWPDEAPDTVLNFVELAEGTREWTDPKSGRKVSRPLYDGTLFHRVIKGFVIQAGDPLSKDDDQQGQVSEGNVVWERVEQPDGLPAIRAKIGLADPKVDVTVTISRNTDQQLPASHLIEIVFALSDQFEGGGIGAIQNFAMKQTEQDTGDPLIAVPAKITESFFMIALNDYVEAVDLNLKLLRERNWIDLPVSYGNGRRALLTMEKGSSGAEIFDQVIRAWEARAESSTQ